jgi:hypothetical protein
LINSRIRAWTSFVAGAGVFGNDSTARFDKSPFDPRPRVKDRMRFDLNGEIFPERFKLSLDLAAFVPTPNGMRLNFGCFAAEMRIRVFRFECLAKTLLLRI